MTHGGIVSSETLRDKIKYTIKLHNGGAFTTVISLLHFSWHWLIKPEFQMWWENKRHFHPLVSYFTAKINSINYVVTINLFLQYWS